MFFFRRKKVEVVKELDRFNHALESSFGHVKSDMNNIYGWLTFLHRQNLRQQRVIESIQSRFSMLINLREELRAFTKEEIRTLVDRHYSEPIREKLRELEEKINKSRVDDVLLQADFMEPVYGKIKTIEEKIEKLILNNSLSLETNKEAQISSQLVNETLKFHLAEKSRYKTYASVSGSQNTFLKERILRKVARDSKEYVKNFIHSLITKYERVSALGLREMVVEDQGLCSKSSFYRILSELEKEDDIQVVQDGKGKIFVSTMVSSKSEKFK